MKTRLKRALLLVLFAASMTAACGRGVRKAVLSAPPATALDKDIYIAEEGGRVRALRPDGSEQWSYSLSDDLERLTGRPSRDISIEHLAARSGGKVYGLATRLSGGQAGASILFALDTGRLVWQKEVPFPEQTSAPVAVGQAAVYLACDDGTLYAYAREDGRELWRYRVSEATIGSPVVGFDGNIYVTGPRGNLHAVAPDGRQLWVAGTSK
jgi:outer membrane protein assembly factor BamB